jgi:hypothetical protein
MGLSWRMRRFSTWRFRNMRAMPSLGLVVFEQPEIALYQLLVEAARNRLAELELEFGI